MSTRHCLFLVPKSGQTGAHCVASAKTVYNPPTPLEPAALPLNWLLNPAKEPDSLIDRILARLVSAEAHEPNAHLKDDYRQAQVALLLAEKGSAAPFVESSYICYGLHPDRVFDAMVRHREALLGPFYNAAQSSGSQVGSSSLPSLAKPPDARDGVTLPEQFPSQNFGLIGADAPPTSQSVSKQVGELSPRKITPKTAKNAPGSGRVVDEEPSADGTSARPAYEVEIPCPKKPVQSVRPERRKKAA